MDKGAVPCYSRVKILTLSFFGCVKGAHMVSSRRELSGVNFRYRTVRCGYFCFWEENSWKLGLRL